MSNWKITIEGSGPCLDNSEDAADGGAKMIVHALEGRGHVITKAEFAGNGKLPKDLLVEMDAEFLERRAAVLQEEADAAAAEKPSTDVPADDSATDSGE